MLPGLIYGDKPNTCKGYPSPTFQEHPRGSHFLCCIAYGRNPWSKNFQTNSRTTLRTAMLSIWSCGSGRKPSEKHLCINSNTNMSHHRKRNVKNTELFKGSLCWHDWIDGLHYGTHQQTQRNHRKETMVNYTPSMTSLFLGHCRSLLFQLTKSMR